MQVRQQRRRRLRAHARHMLSPSISPHEHQRVTPQSILDPYQQPEHGAHVQQLRSPRKHTGHRRAH